MLWVNALAARSGGGISVLEGLGRALVEESDGEVRFLVHESIESLLPDSVRSNAIVSLGGKGVVQRLWWEQARLTQTAARGGIDAVLGFSNLISLVGASRVRQAVLMQNVAPLIGRLRAMYGGRERVRLELLRWLTLRSARAAHVTFVFTKYLKEVIQSEVPRANVVRIPPGGSLEATAGSKRAIGGDPYVLVLSDLRRYKGVEDGIRVLAKPELNGVRLMVCGGAGEPEYRGHLQDLAVKLGVVDRVELRVSASREEVCGLLDDAICLLQTSRFESLGLPVIEALSRGTRVVSTDIPPAREIGGDEIAVYRPGDIQALARAIAAVGDVGEPRRVISSDRSVRFGWRESALAILQELQT